MLCCLPETYRKDNLKLTFFSGPLNRRGKAILYISQADWSNQARLFCALVVTSFFQAFLTLALHVTEVLVNMHRDEDTWRQARKPWGACVYSTPFWDGVNSYSWLLLFILKHLSQWLFAVGISINLAVQAEILFSPLPLSALAGTSLFLVLFSRRMTVHVRRGTQPSTFGHLQTLADVVEQWPKRGELLKCRVGRDSNVRRREVLSTGRGWM